MNKHDINEKYSIAWFRISEYVMRGERERALGVYRLLSHSIHDTSLIAQLEGDIFFFFDDKALACQKYVLAAQGYVASGRLINAVSLYEHIVMLDPHNRVYHQTLYTLSAQLGTEQALHHAQTQLVSYATEHKDFIPMIDFLMDIPDHQTATAVSLKTLFLSWISQHTDAHQEQYLKTIIEYLITHNEHEEASLLVSHIAPFNSDLYTYGIELLSE